MAGVAPTPAGSSQPSDTREDGPPRAAVGADELDSLWVGEAERRSARRQRRRDAARGVGILVRSAAPYVLCVAVPIALILPVWFLFFRTSDVQMTVSEQSWDRSIQVELFRPDERRTWSRFDVPDDAYDQHANQEIHHWDDYTYVCGVDSKGNIKTCTGSDPVYRDRYYYTVDRWMPDGAEHERSTTAREGFVEPFWPDHDLGPATPVVGHRRWTATPDECDAGSGRCEEHLTVRLLNPQGKRQHFHEIQPGQWPTTRVGSRVVGHVTPLGRIRSIDVEQPTAA